MVNVDLKAIYLGGARVGEDGDLHAHVAGNHRGGSAGDKGHSGEDAVLLCATTAKDKKKKI